MVAPLEKILETRENLDCLIYFLGYIKNYLGVSDSMILVALNSIIFKLLSRLKKVYIWEKR